MARFRSINGVLGPVAVRWKRLATGLMLVAALFASPGEGQAQGSTAVANHPTPAQIAQLRAALLALPLAPGNGLLDALTAPDLPDTTAIVQTRSVTIDASYLAEMVAADDLRVVNGEIVSQSIAFAIDLFPDLSVRAVKLRSSVDELGHTVWHGIVAGANGDGEMTMIVNGSSIIADLRLGNESFRIQPMSGVERVVEYDHNALPHPSTGTDAVAPDHSSATPMAPGTPGTPAAAGAPVTIRVLVAYTAAATGALGAGNESTQISAAIADLNQTLANSGNGNVNFVITGTVPTTYVEPANGGSNQILTDLKNGVGDLARIQQLRASQNADLVQLWTVYNDACGLAYYLDDLDKVPNGIQADYGSGFSTVSMVNNLACLGVSEGTAAHEIGHNLGLNHDRFVMPNAVPGPAGYNYGYVDTIGLFQDTMAYNDQCSRLNIRCPRGQYFSNPNVNYTSATMGQRPAGIPDAQATAADNARRVGELAPLVAQFHTVAATAAAPQSLVASILPGGRSVIVNSPATVFATMINTSANPLDGCSVLGPPNAAAGLTFSYQTTDPNNQLVGLPNTFTSLGPNATQNFLLVLQSSVAQQIAAGALTFQCAGAAAAPSIVGVNTLDLTVSATPIADIIALAATTTNNGTLTIPFSTNTAGAFSVASINVGATDTITVRADTGSATLPMTLTLCQTNPATAACLATPAATVTTQIASNTTPTFSIFATASAAIPFSPGASRIFVRFFDQSGGSHGSTSVAVQTQ